MKKKIALVAAGLVAGAVLGSTITATAHHNDRRIKRRLAALESKVSTLQDKTYWLSPEGDYEGFVYSEQVISVCPPATTAVWEENTVDPTLGIQWIDDCFTGQQARARALERLGR